MGCTDTAKRPPHPHPTLPDARAMPLPAHQCRVLFFFPFHISHRLGVDSGQFMLTRTISINIGRNRRFKPKFQKKKGCKTHRFNLITNPKLSQFSKLTYAPFFTWIFNSLSLSVLCLPSWPWIMHLAGEKEDDLSGTQVVAFYHYLDPCLTHHSIFLSITMNYDWSINGFFFFSLGLESLQQFPLLVWYYRP